MTKKIKDFYEKNKEWIKPIGETFALGVGVVASCAAIASTYALGHAKGEIAGKNLTELAFSTLFGEALEKDPNMRLMDFCNQKFIDNLAEEIMERVD